MLVGPPPSIAGRGWGDCVPALVPPKASRTRRSGMAATLHSLQLRSTLARVKRGAWKRGSSSKAPTEGLGLESIRFDTLGLNRDPDEPLNERYWLGPNLMLSEHWFPIPPDLPSLQEDEIRGIYDGIHGPQQPDADGRTHRLLHVSVHHETPVPVVCTLIRVVVPGNQWYSFVGAVTLPLAVCSWVIKVQSDELLPTGIRETLAGARYMRENRTPESSIEDLLSHFDPYDSRWDTDDRDPLTLVRRSINKVLASLDVDLRVRHGSPFR